MMAQKGIREFDAKRMMARWLSDFSAASYDGQVVQVNPQSNRQGLAQAHPWLEHKRLVVKPDQLFGKRGKHDLLLLDADWRQAQNWIDQRMGKEVQVGKIHGELNHFLIEPFVPHTSEYYVAIRSGREWDTIYFSLAGGVNIEENWNQVTEIRVAPLQSIDEIDWNGSLPLGGIEEAEAVVDFVSGLLGFFRKLHFTYLEINPFCIVDGKVVPLDTVARLDDTAAFECREYWGDIEFPVAFGKHLTAEEAYISQLDEKSGSSMKLTVLNPDGRVWLMVAGGGASVIYTDTVVDLGWIDELANYGEYSGNPTKDETKEYARTILDLMTRKKHPGGKVLLIGGGIANFTDVAKTFTGIIEALIEYRDKLIEHKVHVYVRRGGPNYQEGLQNMGALGEKLGIPIEVYGPETHMTRIVPRALEELGAAGGKK
jgi:ATP-citrate lyase beta-subunit